MAVPNEDQSIVLTSLANAILGVGINLHDEALVNHVITEAIALSGPAAPIEPIVFLANFQDVCHGIPSPRPGYPATLAIRNGSKHLFKSASNNSCLDGSARDFVSQIVDWRTIVGMMPDSARIRFGISSDTPPPPSDAVWKELSSLDPSDRIRRRFTPKLHSYWPAKPVHWWTPRNNVETLLAKTSPAYWATALRDKLGLYYSEYDDSGTDKAWMKNLRFALHVRVNTLLAGGHYRPNFVEAGGYCRFAVQRDSVVCTPLDDWGRTADLGCLRDTGDLKDGLPERVSPSVDSVDFVVEPIEFDFLGAIDRGCGQLAIDNHSAFASKLLDLVHLMFPHLESTLDGWKKRIPVTL